MEKPHFVSQKTEFKPFEKLKNEPAYIDKVQQVEGTELVIKETKHFDSLREAEEYIRQSPIKRQDELTGFIPETDYVIGEHPQKGGYQVYTFMQPIEGKRLDEVQLDELDQGVTTQLDDFLAKSLEIYEQEEICPGINLKNFIVDDVDDKLWYIDSEPYPMNHHEPFELAHARAQRLRGMFGEVVHQKLPRTWDWVEKHQVEDYKSAKKAAQARRRAKGRQVPA